MVDGIAAATGRAVRHGFDRLDDVAVVVRSVVDYRTAERVDLAAETARARAAGALVVWDLSHAAGALALELAAAGVELAVGCTYKFLNGGPGAPAFSYVASALQPEIAQPIWGWFGQRDQFAMGPRYEPRDGRRPPAGRHAVDPRPRGGRGGHRLCAEAGIAAIAAKAVALTGYGLELCDRLRARTLTPRDARAGAAPTSPSSTPTPARSTSR